MIATVLWAFGLVLIVEGLAFALAPSRIEDVLKMLAQLTVTQKRSIGGIAVSLGLVFVLAAQVLN